MSEIMNSETLVRYVDGELDPSETQRVEARLQWDAEARETVRGLRESTALLKSAYQGTLDEPLPARVYEGIDRILSETRGGADDTEKGRGRGGAPPWLGLAAAAAVAAILAFPFGYLLSEQSWEQRLARQAADVEADRLARLAALREGLENQVSGEAVAWRNPDSGLGGVATPVRTFKSASGQWCREYETRTELAGGVDVERGIACRDEAGEWRRRVVLIEES